VRALPAAALDPSGQASHAERQPCRTAGGHRRAKRHRLVSASRMADPNRSISSPKTRDGN
jgi:hypothetical protein